MSAFRNMLKLKKDSTPKKVILRISAFILAVLGIKAHTDKAFTGHFSLPEKNTKSESADLAETYSENIRTMAYENTDQQYSFELLRGHGEAYYDFSSDPPLSGESEQDYLGRLHCTGCGKQCLLTNPQCSKGEQMALSAKNDYYELYQNDTQSDNHGELIFYGESSDAVKNIFSTMIPVMSLYVGGTHYILKFAKRNK